MPKLTTSEPYAWHCNACRQRVTVPVWTIIDVRERADLLQAGIDFDKATCPKCGIAAPISYPLIVLNASPVAPIVILSPRGNLDSQTEELNNIAHVIADRAAAIARIPGPAIDAERTILEYLTSRDVSQDLQEWQNSGASPVKSDAYADFLRQASDTSILRRIQEAVRDFWDVRSPDELGELFRTYPELLDSSTCDEYILALFEARSELPDALKEGCIRLFADAPATPPEKLWQDYTSAVAKVIAADAEKLNNLRDQIEDAMRRGESGDRLVDLCRDLLNIAIPLGATWDEAVTRSIIAGLFLKPENYANADVLEESVAHLERAIEIAQASGQRAEEARWRVNLAVALGQRLLGDRQQNSDRAIDNLEAAVEIYHEIAAMDSWALAQTNLALAFMRRPGGSSVDDFRRALTACQAALTIRKPERNALDYAYTQINMGLAYSRLIPSDPENVSNAVNCYEEAISCLTPEDSPAEWSQAHHDLGTLHLELGQSDDNTPQQTESHSQNAELHLRASLVVRTRTSDPRGWVNSSWSLARAIYMDPGRAPEAASICDEILEVVTPASWPDECLAISKWLLHVRGELGEWKEAAEAGVGAVEAIEAILDATPAEHLTKRLSENPTLWRWAAYALFRAGVLENQMGDSGLATRNFNLAVRIVERGRARLLGEALQRDAANVSQLAKFDPMLARDFLQARDTLRAALQNPQEASSPATAMNYSDTLSRIRSISGFEGFLRGASVGEIATSLPRGERLVYIVAAPTGSCAFVLAAGAHGAGEIGAIDLPGITSAEIATLLLGFNAFGMGESPKLYLHYLDRQSSPRAFADALKQSLDQLGPLLVRPIWDEVGGTDVESIVLIPAGPMGILPLHCAPWLDSAGHPISLIDLVSVRYAPSGLTLVTTRQRASASSSGPKKLVGVGDPARSGPALPGAYAEISAIAESFPGEKSIAFGEQATASFIVSEMSSATNLHFACHAEVDLFEPRSSALVMAGGERLTLNRLQHLSATEVRLAVIAACDSAAFEISAMPDEVASLPTGFLQAGAAGVIAALWPVDDEATALLMTQFYQICFTSGSSYEPAEALRQAQLWLRDMKKRDVKSFYRDHPNVRNALRGERSTRSTMLAKLRRPHRASRRPFSHPEYWAPFVYYGC